MNPLFAHFQRAFEDCSPYLLATKHNQPFFEMSPLGISIAKRGLILDPQKRANESFLHLVQELDKITFGPLEMTMPKWVSYDAGIMPSGIFGFCAQAPKLEQWVKRALAVPEDYIGQVPLTQLIAIPTPEKGAWYLHTISSINQVCMGAAAPANLILLTLCLAVRVFRMQRLYGASQWRSSRLNMYVSLGPLEILTAYTYNHSVQKTVTWCLDIQRPLVEAALINDGASTIAPPATHMIDVDDVEQLKFIQKEIEQGVKYHIVGSPLIRGSIVQVPVRRSK